MATSWRIGRGRTLRVYAPHALYVVSRIWSLVGGMLQVACAYAMGRMLSGRYAALCAGLLVAVCFTLVQHGHYIKPGPLATGLMMLAAWAALAALRSGDARSRGWLYALAGVVDRIGLRNALQRGGGCASSRCGWADACLPPPRPFHAARRLDGLGGHATGLFLRQPLHPARLCALLARLPVYRQPVHHHGRQCGGVFPGRSPKRLGLHHHLYGAAGAGLAGAGLCRAVLRRRLPRQTPDSALGTRLDRRHDPALRGSRLAHHQTRAQRQSRHADSALCRGAGGCRRRLAGRAPAAVHAHEHAPSSPCC